MSLRINKRKQFAEQLVLYFFSLDNLSNVKNMKLVNKCLEKITSGCFESLNFKKIFRSCNGFIVRGDDKIITDKESEQKFNKRDYYQIKLKSKEINMEMWIVVGHKIRTNEKIYIKQKGKKYINKTK